LGEQRGSREGTHGEQKVGRGEGELTVRSDPIRCEDLIMTDQTGLVERASVDGPVVPRPRSR
jgi:hypothetical protein